MKARELQELLDFIAKSGLNKVNIETEEFKISVQREPSYKPVVSMSAPAPASVPVAPPVQAAPAAAAPTTAPAPAAVPAAAPATEATGGNYVPLKAPMIGTFYRSNSPDAPAFVQVGDTVEKGQVICIIEAMKLFNEIEAEQSGRVVKALVENASPVEYDQPLFLIEPM
ncbi:acetyl-CoA carboxylase biotin carboxyl carrier protein [Hymenobacter weizhouensis]|uniref:acetyl-CoA carboxylase biotin carboxyl carrier protein n=1 Tax=Hymenobacter sp. YIM 151500-1 TaxID=2987689 RepID=UPI002226A5C7|nr:acetyl-CoA carboxylase biotin carboxyl carrier protein [Hymenobacter sp. YIM 151500-1]UYZ64428.1 acetyl-CoA carboxylase biotin carboxyl carrier protein [Hymenobacter sp. YIM 151500-1]